MRCLTLLKKSWNPQNASFSAWTALLWRIFWEFGDASIRRLRHTARLDANLSLSIYLSIYLPGEQGRETATIKTTWVVVYQRQCNYRLTKDLKDYTKIDCEKVSRKTIQLTKTIISYSQERKRQRILF